MTGSMSDWQRRLDLEGSVTFRLSTLRIVVYFVGCLLFVVVGIVSLLTDGTPWWAVGVVVLFGGGALVLGPVLWARGVPSLTVTRAGLTRSGRREVAFREIREVITSARTFGFVWTPGPGDELRGRWQRRHGLKYASIPADGVVDPELLAQWVLHMKDPAGEIVVEPRFSGMGKTWRLSVTDIRA